MKCEESVQKGINWMCKYVAKEFPKKALFFYGAKGRCTIV